MGLITAGQLMTYSEKRALQGAFGSAVTTMATPYMALLTNITTGAAGSPDNTWTTIASAAEYQGGPANGYARAAFGALTGPSSASPSVVSNAAAMTWGPFTAVPGTSPTNTVSWGVLVDASAGTTANLSVIYLLSSPRTPQVGDSLSAAIASFTCSV